MADIVTGNDSLAFLKVECGWLNVSAPDTKHAVTLSDCVSSKRFGAFLNVGGRYLVVDRLCISLEDRNAKTVRYTLILLLKELPAPSYLDKPTTMGMLTEEILRWLKVSVAAYLEFASESDVSFNVPDRISCELIGPDDLGVRIGAHTN
jgi:hypothetical protein